MIKYLQGSTNEVIVTLTERVTISNPFFLLVLLNKSTDVETKIWCTDVSAYPSRYNQFNLSNSLSINDYIYNFYQKPNQDNTDLDDAVFLETGVWKVYEVATATKSYFN